MSDPVTKLILELAKLPGIGEKTAMRLAYHILRTSDTDVRMLSDAIIEAKSKTKLCSECFTFTEQERCSICMDPQRKSTQVCVVEKPSDVLAIENSQRFDGIYHVLHGVLSPLDGIGPDQIRIKELLARLETRPIREVILALNPTIEGDTTGIYLSKLLKPLGISVTKIANGIPVGGVLEYVDRQTIGRAIENRVTAGL